MLRSEVPAKYAKHPEKIPLEKALCSDTRTRQ